MSDCVEWQGARTSAGYGERSIAGRVRLVHRLAWEEVFGPIPAGLEVMHICDNPPCYRLDHLALGTHAANMAMAAVHGFLVSWSKHTHCVRGHEFTPENTYHPPKRPTHRHCRACARDRARGGQ